MDICCQQDVRRDAVRRKTGWNGLDFLEVTLAKPPSKGAALTVYFLGKLPPEFTGESVNLSRYLKLEGGHRIKDITILSVEAVTNPDSSIDDFLTVRLDKAGDYSSYTLSMAGVLDIDPRYDRINFSFKLDCPQDLDCVPACACEPPVIAEPEINYLAKDYASFRQLILDRLAVLTPDWTERHVPDFGITLVELMAYVGDYLSYYQDAVATEAYLETARQRISVHRHVRLVDYFLHEGCNSRAWVSVETKFNTPELASTDIAFITGLNNALPDGQTIFSWDDLRQVPSQTYEVFEPLPSHPSRRLRFYRDRSKISFYTWGEVECCLAKGSTSATLLDHWVSREPPTRALDTLTEGDVLVFEELIGPKTGLAADADPLRRHAVRVTGITRGSDPVIEDTEGQPTLYVEIQWAEEDALPFTLCISVLGPSPDCDYIKDISVARGNVVLVDLGKTVSTECLGEVPQADSQPVCECVGHPGEIQRIPGRYRPRLSATPLTFSVPLSADAPSQWPSAIALMGQDVHAAVPNVRLFSLSAELRRYFAQANLCDQPFAIVEDASGAWLHLPTERLPAALAKNFPDGRLPALVWQARYDLLESEPDDLHFVVEIDNDGMAQLRFGDDDLGRQPEAGMVFFAQYRIGNGTAGNVGADSISRLILNASKLDGAGIRLHNPLPAVGGTDPEPIAEAKLYAPHTFRKEIERAITADDYRVITERNRKLQAASAELEWTGSWYEAEVAVDPLGAESAGQPLLAEIEGYLHSFRRMGNDLRVVPACYVPIDLKLEICVLPHYQQAHVNAALLDVFSNRKLAGGKTGFFHPDNLSFGDDIYVSKIIAVAMAVKGVECARVTRLKRQFEDGNAELENGKLPLSNHEIAQLDNDPVYPERGRLELKLSGGI